MGWGAWAGLGCVAGWAGLWLAGAGWRLGAVTMGCGAGWAGLGQGLGGWGLGVLGWAAGLGWRKAWRNGNWFIRKWEGVFLPQK